MMRILDRQRSLGASARRGAVGLALAALVGLALMTAACGGSSGQAVAQVDTTGTTSTESDSSDGSSSGDPTAYSACMRKNGVPKFPDPDSDGALRLKAGPGTGIDPDSAQFRAAAKACAKAGPPSKGGPSPAQRAKDREQMLAFAACMRRQGLPKFPDPTNGGLVIKRGGDIDPESPQFKEAEKACEDLLPGAARDGGPSGSEETS
jgi:hypothetical protein